jgi:hypothetical protein
MNNLEFDNKLMRNDEEETIINNVLLERAQNILNEFGPEGAYKMSEILLSIANKDVTDSININTHETDL